MAKASSQKFIARNRAPRVQIEYDVELYGAEKKIQLPFVMGVLADLSGKPTEPLPPVADRKFLDIDVDNFDSRMKALKPRVAFAVPNTLTGEGNMMVELTFESMDDFSPAAVARKVDALNKLLEARQQLLGAGLAVHVGDEVGELRARLQQLVERVDLARHGGGREVVHALEGELDVEIALAGQRVGHLEGDARLHRLEALVEVVHVDLDGLALIDGW